MLSHPYKNSHFFYLRRSLTCSCALNRSLHFYLKQKHFPKTSTMSHKPLAKWVLYPHHLSNLITECSTWLWYMTVSVLQESTVDFTGTPTKWIWVLTVYVPIQYIAWREMMRFVMLKQLWAGSWDPALRNSFYYLYFDCLVQDCSNSSALAMELLQSCAKPLICRLYISLHWNGRILCESVSSLTSYSDCKDPRIDTN